MSSSMPSGQSDHDGAPPVTRDVAMLLPARAGDHPNIFQLLQQLFHAPGASEFQALQEDPLYEPSDWLIVRGRTRLLGQVQVTPRTMQFGSLELPVALVQHLGLLPEYRGAGFARALLEAAEEKMVAEGARLGWLRTAIPGLFARSGWVVCGRHSYSTATARDIRSQLSSLNDRTAASRPPLEREIATRTIRVFRQVERESLVRLFHAASRSQFGPLLRSDAYWQWLISRRAFDRIYVSLLSSEAAEAHGPPQIIGYAVVRGSRIVELVTVNGEEQAALELLGHACSDAIERDDAIVRLDLPPQHHLHRVMQNAGGRTVRHEAQQGEVFMAKLFEPWKLLADMRETIFQRAREANVTLPCELGLTVDGEKCQIALTRRSAKLIRGKVGRSYLACGAGEFAQLLLGHLDVAEAVACGRITASTRVAAELARSLFPQLPLWFPPLDTLPAE